MSITIYEGRMIPLPVDKVLNTLVKYKTTCKNAANRHLKKTIEWSDADLQDDIEKDPFYKVLIKNHLSVFRGIDLSYNISIFPMKDKTLFIPFIQTENVYPEVPGAKYWGWWNNVDKDDCPEEEWKQRGKDWGKVLVGKGLSGVPSEQGVSVSLVDLREVLDMYLLLRHDEWKKTEGDNLSQQRRKSD